MYFVIRMAEQRILELGAKMARKSDSLPSTKKPMRARIRAGKVITSLSIHRHLIILLYDPNREQKALLGKLIKKPSALQLIFCLVSLSTLALKSLVSEAHLLIFPHLNHLRQCRAASLFLSLLRGPVSIIMPSYSAAELISNLIFGLLSIVCNLVLVWQNERIVKECRSKGGHSRG
ncbi:hypothetical protein F5Y19DRAFT_450416 [Xylariaceae sp. FL1651]|nr:hypothetical protein F5Y19DRAFT_450416 [Xylariaceae sp. FL1651]